MRIGILAYGSLINDRGELEDLIEEERTGLRTPFRVEFARSSTSTRRGAPTLVPVHRGGAYVEAVLFVLRPDVSLDEARDSLYRREIQCTNRAKRYKPDPDKANQVWVEVIPEWAGMDYVLYTRISSNIRDLNPEKLASLAIESAESEAGPEGKDGIQYLIRAKEAGVRTPLSDPYEVEILQRTSTSSLQEAREGIVDG